MSVQFQIQRFWNQYIYIDPFRYFLPFNRTNCLRILSSSIVWLSFVKTSFTARCSAVCPSTAWHSSNTSYTYWTHRQKSHLNNFYTEHSLFTECIWKVTLKIDFGIFIGSSRRGILFEGSIRKMRPHREIMSCLQNKMESIRFNFRLIIHNISFSQMLMSRYNLVWMVICLRENCWINYS